MNRISKGNQAIRKLSSLAKVSETEFWAFIKLDINSNFNYKRLAQHIIRSLGYQFKNHKWVKSHKPKKKSEFYKLYMKIKSAY